MAVRRLIWIAALGSALVVGAVPSATAQNLVPNGSFDSDISGWYEYNPFEGTAQWYPDDASGAADSGSARLVNQVEGTSFGYGMSDCIGAGTTGPYLLTGKVFVPSGQTESGVAWIGLQWQSDGGCAGSSLGTTVTSVGPVATDTWESLELAIVDPPPGALTAWMLLLTQKNEAGGSFEVRFDEITVVPILFSDGFETGNTSAWSQP